MRRQNPLPFVLLLAVALLALFLKSPVTQTASGSPVVLGDVAWMLTASALVLLMTPGLSFFYGGMVGFKNVVSTMLQSVIALGVISLVWVAVGFGLAFGTDVGGYGIIGNPFSYWMFNGVGGDTAALGSGAELKLT